MRKYHILSYITPHLIIKVSWYLVQDVTRVFANISNTSFDFDTVRCIFLGYSINQRGYRCLSPSGRICVSSYVCFNEECFPFVDGFSQQPITNPNSSDSIISQLPIRYASANTQILSVPLASNPSSMQPKPNVINTYPSIPLSSTHSPNISNAQTNSHTHQSSPSSLNLSPVLHASSNQSTSLSTALPQIILSSSTHFMDTRRRYGITKFK